MDLSASIKKLNRKYVMIKIEHLKVWTKEEKSWWRRKPTKPEVIIVNDVSASIKTGEFVAVIGPSGAGKTTFLVSLAGKCTLPNSGTVTVNGTDIKKVQRGLIEIVPQFDVFMDSITVKEHLLFMTEMKLGSVKKSSHRQTLAKLLKELKLTMLQYSPISSLSGGERRLLSLATSLLSSPQIIICDEPTTGLDSYNAALVIGVLKQLAVSGRTVICSVHQPSSDLFKEFNSIALMSEGRMVFHGSQGECKKLFEKFNLRCPKNYNPAEFYIKAVSEASNDYASALENYCDQSDECDESSFVAARTHRHLQT
ncbi:jg22033 [Pararge aegeria aegeria]|uniref:Jg22033 protein n=1 Tax=Pararge aegeria aegeria TaxID=348720 RepID=A0A8S4RHZ0_9NEOP|nr:jg22033 [Pararge aegeria aegeria]